MRIGSVREFSPDDVIQFGSSGNGRGFNYRSPPTDRGDFRRNLWRLTAAAAAATACCRAPRSREFAASPIRVPREGKIRRGRMRVLVGASRWKTVRLIIHKHTHTHAHEYTHTYTYIICVCTHTHMSGRRDAVVSRIQRGRTIAANGSRNRN